MVHSTPSSHLPDPKDIPGSRSPALEPLHMLVGTWFITMTHVALSGPVSGWKVYAWLEGGHFLIERSHFNHPEVPDSIAIIGADETGEGLTERYFDSRGVSRTFQMSLDGGVWRAWRDAPGFSQRFTGRFIDDGQAIDVLGELSTDGVNWQTDFTHQYSKGKAEA